MNRRCSFCAAALVLLVAALSAIPSSAMPLGLRLIATPKSKWDAKDPMELTEAEAYERYAPDTAYVVNVGAGDYVDLQVVSWAGGTADSDKWVDWGDGTREVVTGSIPKHTYEASGNYVVRISSNCTGFRAGWYNNALSGHKYIVRVLRFGDNVNYYNNNFRKCARATCFPDGKLPRWSKAAASVKAFSSIYADCTALAATSLPAWPASLTSTGYTFYNCKSLAATSLPAWPASMTSADGTFQNCTSLAATSLPAWPTTMTSASGTFQGCTSLAATSLPAWPSGMKSANSTFMNCTSLAATELPAWPTSLTQANSTFLNCKSLAATSLPAWPTSLTQANGTFQNCKSLTSAWTDDPAELMPTNITSHGNCVSGTSAALRALFYSDWGGTRTKTE